MNSGLKRWWPLPLRLLVGVGFVCHGLPKVFSGAGHRSLIGVLHQLGVPFPEIASRIVGVVEFVGGIAILEGMFFSAVTVLLIADVVAMLVAAHLYTGLNFVSLAGWTAAMRQMGTTGTEVKLLYVAALSALLLGGPGPLSISDLARRARGSRASAPAREVHA